MSEDSDKIAYFDLDSDLKTSVDTTNSIINILSDPTYGLEAIKTAIGDSVPTDIEKCNARLEALAASDPDLLSFYPNELGSGILRMPVTYHEYMHFSAIGYGIDGPGRVTLCAITSRSRLRYHNSDGDAELVEWADCDLRAHLRTTFFRFLPYSVQTAIIPVTKKVGIRNSYNITENEETIWIPSATEIFGNSIYNSSYGDRYSIGEGEQYPGFRSPGARVKYCDAYYAQSVYRNEIMYWFSRSPIYTTTNTAVLPGAISVNNVGDVYLTQSGAGIGVVPCFCI